MSYILVAEDDRNTRYLIKQILLRKEYPVLEAENGLQALKVLQLYRGISLIITDIHMAEMDGIELLEKAKNHFPTIPVIMLTAQSNSELLQTSLQKGALCYLVKPFTHQQLMTLVEDVLNSSV